MEDPTIISDNRAQGGRRSRCARAVAEGFDAQQRWLDGLREQGGAILDQLEAEERVGIVMLGRPHHHDPGLNDGIFEEFQKLGYPVLSQTSLPVDPWTIEPVFGSDHHLDIEDAWKHSFSASTSRKIWAPVIDYLLPVFAGQFLARGGTMMFASGCDACILCSRMGE